MVRATILALAFGPAIALANVISYSDSFDYQPLDWDNQLTLKKFNPALGTLQNVTVSLTGNLNGEVRAENYSSKPRVITLTATADLDLSLPGAFTVHVIAQPLQDTIFNAPKYDGRLDYAGSDSIDIPNIYATDTKSYSTSNQAELAAYLGSDNLYLAISGISNSNASAGNVQSLFLLNAGASATVTYEYVAVPEPGMIFTALAVSGSALMLRTRKPMAKKRVRSLTLLRD